MSLQWRQATGLPVTCASWRSKSSEITPRTSRKGAEKAGKTGENQPVSCPLRRAHLARAEMRMQRIGRPGLPAAAFSARGGKGQRAESTCFDFCFVFAPCLHASIRPRPASACAHRAAAAPRAQLRLYAHGEPGAGGCADQALRRGAARWGKKKTEGVQPENTGSPHGGDDWWPFFSADGYAAFDRAPLDTGAAHACLPLLCFAPRAQRKNSRSAFVPSCSGCCGSHSHSRTSTAPLAEERKAADDCRPLRQPARGAETRLFHARPLREIDRAPQRRRPATLADP